MLVFSRKSGERMWISDNVEVTVLGIHGTTVWLGFTAPPGVVIERVDGEVNDQTLQEAISQAEEKPNEVR